MKRQGTLLLKRSDIVELLALKECILSVENAFKMYALGKSLGSGLLHFSVKDVDFHIKAGGLHI